jgi:hypothetical protein
MYQEQQFSMTQNSNHATARESKRNSQKGIVLLTLDVKTVRPRTIRRLSDANTPEAILSVDSDRRPSTRARVNRIHITLGNEWVRVLIGRNGISGRYLKKRTVGNT